MAVVACSVATREMVSRLDTRHKHILRVLKQHYSLSETHIEYVLVDEQNFGLINDFFRGDEKVPKLIFYYQTRDAILEDGELIEAGEMEEPQLFMTTGELDRQKSSGVYFLRTKKPGSPDGAVGTANPELDMSYGIVPPLAMEGLRAMLTDLYMPLIDQESNSWQKVMGAEDSTSEFFSLYKRFSDTLGEARIRAHSMPPPCLQPTDRRSANRLMNCLSLERRR